MTGARRLVGAPLTAVRGPDAEAPSVLDLKQLRADPDAARAALDRRGAGDAIDRVLELDEQRRGLIPEVEGLRAQQNEANGAIAAAKSAGEDASEAIARMREVAGEAKRIGEQLAAVEADLEATIARLPNLPEPGAPLEDTVLQGSRAAGAGGRDHLELAGSMIDMEHGALLSGARFAYLRGDLVLLELALVRWVLGKLRGHGFEPVIPPVLVREEALYGTGFLPDTEQQIYHLPDDDLFLVGTSEVALASLHAGEIVDAGELPLRYAGFSPCFRREAGAAGRDTRGIFRVHQFDKVEMFCFVEPDQSVDEHQRLLAIEEEILTDLGIPYRVVDIAVGDLGNSAARKFDCEAWLPGQERYRELTSCSNTTDYQARRLNIRARPAGGKPETLHTLNGTAVAVGRTIIALLENGQRDDGSVALPAVLAEHGAPDRTAGSGLSALAGLAAGRGGRRGLIERAQSILTRRAEPEGAVEPRHLEDAAHALRRLDDREHPAGALDAALSVEQQAQARGVDEIDLREVDHEADATVADLLVDGQRDANPGSDRKLAVQHQNGDIRGQAAGLDLDLVHDLHITPRGRLPNLRLHFAANCVPIAPPGSVEAWRSTSTPTSGRAPAAIWSCCRS